MKNKKITLDSINIFLLAAKTDLIEQQSQFEGKYTGLIAAVDEAQKFAIKHQDEIKQKKYIAIVENEGKIVQVGWEKDLSKPKGILYRFDPKSDVENPYNMGEYIKRREQFTIRIDDLDQAIKIIQKLQSNKYIVQNPVELLPITRVIDRHEEYLNTISNDNPTAEQQKMIDLQGSVIDKFIELIKKQEKPKGKVRRFFKGIKYKRKKKL